MIIPISTSGAVVVASLSVFPTGVTLYDPAKAYNSFVLLDGRDGKTHLVDMNGAEVRSWPYVGFPSEYINPELIGGKRGHVFVQKEGPSFAAKVLAELDWDGNVVWEWGAKAPGGSANQNHDQARLPNGNTLVLSNRSAVIELLSREPVIDQCIYEVSPGGDIVWQWFSSEHLDEFFSPEALETIRSGYRTTTGTSGFLTLNNAAPLGPNKWFRGGDRRFHPDNIMIDAREANFIAVIEKTSGKIVWRLGPDFPRENPYIRAFNHEVPRPVDQLSGQHDAHLIPAGLPGGGNLLVFDNQSPAGYPQPPLYLWLGSRVLEIDPIKSMIVWQYNAEDSGRPLWTFFSSFISSARRLPNGNTLIDEGMNGRIFQITPQGEIVWEYVSPYFGDWKLRQSVHGSGMRSVRTNWVFRAQPVPYDWAPEGTPRSERPVPALDPAAFRVFAAGAR
jgi:hypothetical protein